MNHEFPLEIVHRILAYDGRIRYRMGKYANQVNLRDYEFLDPVLELKYELQSKAETLLDGSFLFCVRHPVFEIMYDYMYYGIPGTYMISIVKGDDILNYQYK